MKSPDISHPPFHLRPLIYDFRKASFSTYASLGIHSIEFGEKDGQLHWLISWCGYLSLSHCWIFVGLYNATKSSPTNIFTTTSRARFQSWHKSKETRSHHGWERRTREHRARPAKTGYEFYDVEVRRRYMNTSIHPQTHPCRGAHMLPQTRRPPC